MTPAYVRALCVKLKSSTENEVAGYLRLYNTHGTKIENYIPLFCLTFSKKEFLLAILYKKRTVLRSKQIKLKLDIFEKLIKQILDPKSRFFF